MSGPPYATIATTRPAPAAGGIFKSAAVEVLRRTRRLHRGDLQASASPAAVLAASSLICNPSVSGNTAFTCSSSARPDWQPPPPFTHRQPPLPPLPRRPLLPPLPSPAPQAGPGLGPAHLLGQDPRGHHGLCHVWGHQEEGQGLTLHPVRTLLVDGWHCRQRRHPAAAAHAAHAEHAAHACSSACAWTCAGACTCTCACALAGLLACLLWHAPSSGFSCSRSPLPAFARCRPQEGMFGLREWVNQGWLPCWQEPSTSSLAAAAVVTLAAPTPAKRAAPRSGSGIPLPPVGGAFSGGIASGKVCKHSCIAGRQGAALLTARPEHFRTCTPLISPRRPCCRPLQQDAPRRRAAPAARTASGAPTMSMMAGSCQTLRREAAQMTTTTTSAW
jgi:hypothetical protein